ncbi:hypothetical protein V1T75_01960 [Tenacibaculum sp. FZY0031]|uniref:hypothetical protein n=1 Tax=unclassified Tenacibaculum TaxID=2635139 RepID=UPI002EADC4DB|nr:hypothetical protein [Tenacibaculum sp. FZY0031]
MKKQILNLGKTLNRKEQQEVKGGFPFSSCEQFCSFTWRGEEDRQLYLEHQLNTYGLDWSHCVC